MIDKNKYSELVNSMGCLGNVVNDEFDGHGFYVCFQPYKIDQIRFAIECSEKEGFVRFKVILDGLMCQELTREEKFENPEEFSKAMFSMERYVNREIVY